jgi:hypothetical protein
MRSVIARQAAVEVLETMAAMAAMAAIATIAAIDTGRGRCDNSEASTHKRDDALDRMAMHGYARG